VPVRVAALDLASVEPLDQGDVTDPAGGDEQDYVDCARELVVLIDELVGRLALDPDGLSA
jgi:protein-tyrosine-phosphatase